MKNYSLLMLISLTILLQLKCTTQKNENSTKSPIPIADEILHKDYKPIDVMLFASWHFSYINSDSHKTEEENMIDLSSEKRQNEILEVVARLNKFKPTIIF